MLTTLYWGEQLRDCCHVLLRQRIEAAQWSWHFVIMVFISWRSVCERFGLHAGQLRTWASKSSISPCHRILFHSAPVHFKSAVREDSSFCLHLAYSMHEIGCNLQLWIACWTVFKIISASVPEPSAVICMKSCLVFKAVQPEGQQRFLHLLSIIRQ